MSGRIDTSAQIAACYSVLKQQRVKMKCKCGYTWEVMGYLSMLDKICICGRVGTPVEYTPGVYSILKFRDYLKLVESS